MAVAAGAEPQRSFLGLPNQQSMSRHSFHLGALLLLNIRAVPSRALDKARRLDGSTCFGDLIIIHRRHVTLKFTVYGYNKVNLASALLTVTS